MPRSGSSGNDVEPTRDPASSDIIALALRSPDGTLVKTMTVGLPPEEVVATLVDPRFMVEVMEPRSPRDELPFKHEFLFGRQVYYERTSDGLVLWRRPEYQRGRFYEPLPYPDMVEVLIGAAPRGSQVELRWRPHPRTELATNRFLGWAAFYLIAVVVMVFISLRGAVGPVLVLSLVFLKGIHRLKRASRDIRALQPLLLRAHTVLARYEIGRADAEGSAFRALPSQDEAVLPSPHRRSRRASRRSP